MKQVVIKPQTHKRLKAFCKARGMKIGAAADMLLLDSLQRRKTVEKVAK
jgi:hypothetical protein